MQDKKKKDKKKKDKKKKKAVCLLARLSCPDMQRIRKGKKGVEQQR